MIRRLTKRYFEKGRTFISKEVCKALNWRQPNGWLKDRACRDVLLQLAKLRFIKLPISKIRRGTKKILVNKQPILNSDSDLIQITKYPEMIALEFAKGDQKELIWNSIVQQYHYLGHRVVVGRCLKYLIKADNILVGGICFSSSVWHLESRNKLLSKIIDPKDIRDLVINNSRFLILPNVKIPNLASTILSLATKRIVVDWENYYAITPQFAETFVEPSKFLGTCYKASNWIEVGVTKGYAKQGASFHNSQKPKQIFLYGLTKVSRKKLASVISTRDH